MASSPTVRDRSRLAVAAVSGLTTITALCATGWLAGAAARTTQADQPTPDRPDAGSRTAADHHRRVVVRPRPQRTHVTTRYVQGTASAPVGSGGTVSQSVSQPASQPVTHTPSAPAPHHTASPPAPSSGS